MQPVSLTPITRRLVNDLTGRRFGRLVAIECLGGTPDGTVWRCQCDCGKCVDKLGPRLASGNTSSCGCYRRENAARRAKHPRERFETFVLRTDTCWLWQGVLSNRGYGLLSVSGRYVGAHRFAYTEFVGPIRDGLFVCHRCDVRKCVNPNHLFLGTQSDNVKDMVAKGRHVCNLPDNTKVSDADIAQIRDRCSKGEYQKIVAAAFGISQQQVSKIIVGTRRSGVSNK